MEPSEQRLLLPFGISRIFPRSRSGLVARVEILLWGAVLCCAVAGPGRMMCKKVVPRWSQLPLDSLAVARVSGGITNIRTSLALPCSLPSQSCLQAGGHAAVSQALPSCATSAQLSTYFCSGKYLVGLGAKLPFRNWPLILLLR